MASYYTSGYTPPQGVTSADQVRAIQQQLTQAGYNVGNTGADGIWGKNTQAAYDSYLAAGGNTGGSIWSSPAGVSGGSMYGSSGFSMPSLPSYDIGAAYDRSAEQYKAALDAAYNSQKAGIDAQAAKLSDQYNAVRSNAYTNARLNAIGNNEVMASLGLAGNMYKSPVSGVSETSRVNQDIGMRNDINSATRQEQAERDNLALELMQAGYTRDVEYAKWMADMLIAKANAEQAAAQQAFENQMALAKMYADMYGGMGGSSSGVSGGSRSPSKKTTTAIPTYASAKNYLETISKQGATRKDMSSEIAGMNLPQYQKDILNSYSKILSTGFTKPSNRALCIAYDNVYIDRVILPESPAPSNRLIIGFKAIRQPNKDDFVAILPVHPEPGDFRFTHENAVCSLRKPHHCRFFVLDAVRTLNLYGSFYGLRKRVALRVQIAPYKHLFIRGVCDFRSCFHAVINALASCVSSLVQRLACIRNQPHLPG